MFMRCGRLNFLMEGRIAWGLAGENWGFEAGFLVRCTVEVDCVLYKSLELPYYVNLCFMRIFMRSVERFGVC